MAKQRSIKNVDESAVEEVTKSKIVLIGLIIFFCTKCCEALFDKCRNNFSENLKKFDAYSLQNIFHPSPSNHSSSDTNLDQSSDMELKSMQLKHTALNLELLYLSTANAMKDSILKDLNEGDQFSSSLKSLERESETATIGMNHLVSLTKTAQGEKRNTEEIYFLFIIYSLFPFNFFRVLFGNSEFTDKLNASRKAHKRSHQGLLIFASHLIVINGCKLQIFKLEMYMIFNRSIKCYGADNINSTFNRLIHANIL